MANEGEGVPQAPKIYLGIPTRGVVFTETLKAAFLNLGGVTWQFGLFTLSPVSEARNTMVREFLKTNCTHLFTLDDDEVPPVGILKKMLDAGQPVVVVDAPAKRTGRSNIFRDKDGTIAATGFGCALFKREVFEKLHDPWFSLLPRRTVRYRSGKHVFTTIDDAPENPYGGEDVNFSLKLKDNGIEIVALDEICTHLEYEPFNTDRRAVETLLINRYTEITDRPI